MANVAHRRHLMPQVNTLLGKWTQVREVDGFRLDGAVYETLLLQGMSAGKLSAMAKVSLMCISCSAHVSYLLAAGRRSPKLPSHASLLL